MASLIAIRTVEVETQGTDSQLSTDLIPLPDGVSLAREQSLTDAVPLLDRDNPPETPVFSLIRGQERAQISWELFDRLALTDGMTPVGTVKRWLRWWVNQFVENHPREVTISCETTTAVIDGRLKECYQRSLNHKTWLVGAVERRMVTNG